SPRPPRPLRPPLLHRSAKNSRVLFQNAAQPSKHAYSRDRAHLCANFFVWNTDGATCHDSTTTDTKTNSGKPLTEVTVLSHNITLNSQHTPVGPADVAARAG